MKRKHVILYGASIALIFGLFACQKQKTSPASGPSSLNVSLQAVNPSFSLPVSSTTTKASLASGPSITWDTANMVVSGVSFEASLKKMNSEEDSIEIEYKWRGPKMVNLLDTTATFGSFTLQPGLYDQVELRISGLREDAAGKPAFYLYGTYAENDTTSVPIIVKSYQNIIFKTKQDSVNVTSNLSANITSYIQIYLNKLMANVQPADLNSAETVNGAIVISDSTNMHIFYSILHNLEMDHHCYYRHRDDHRD
ncbi:MAG: hypothetical protein IH595_03130 [Bacteroidales bacterium]|nr:hypothetical protein [Bacteroidales bacterium]